jgi:hypothetical protein
MNFTRGLKSRLQHILPGANDEDIENVLYGEASQQFNVSQINERNTIDNEESDSSEEFEETLEDLNTLQQNNIMSLEGNEALMARVSKRHLHHQEVDALITKFDNCGISIDLWIRKLESLKRTYKWDDEEILLYATQSLSGAPKLWYIPEEILDWETFKNEIKLEFKREVNLVDIHNNLRKMEPEKNETYEVFAYRLRNYAKPHGIEDSAIISYVICGLSNEKIYNALYNRSYESFTSFIKCLRESETNLKLRRPQKFVKKTNEFTTSKNIIWNRK